MLQISGLYKAFGDRELFRDATLSLDSRTRLTLFGRNGSGKSTLFKILVGEDHADKGTIHTPRDYRIGYLKQHLSFGNGTVLEEVCESLEDHEHYKGEIVLEGLGLSEEQIFSSPHSLSGGYQIRVNLAKLILSEPDLLLLDEPTNYLDIISVRWLERYLRNWPGEMILISHDRSFCDAVSTHSALLYHGTFRKVQGNSEKLFAQVAETEELQARTRENQLREKERLMQFINKFRAKASKASVVQSRVKALGRIEIAEELQSEASLDFKFTNAPFPGRFPLEAFNVSFKYADDLPLLIDDMSLSLGKRERIGVIGKNGRGKSTFLRLIADELTPSSGNLVFSPNAKVGFFGQTNIDRLDPARTIVDEIRSANELLSMTQLRTICGVMMFEGDDALKKVKVLSGGERSRVLLGKILATPANVLLLDEPTNHLDLESVEALTDALDIFEGSVMLVTHNELLLRRVATRLIVFEREGPQIFEGTYDEFLQTRGWEDERGTQPTNQKQTKEKATPKPVDSTQRDKTVKNLEKRIAELEANVSLIQGDLSRAAMGKNGSEITKLSKALADAEATLARAMSEWEGLV